MLNKEFPDKAVILRRIDGHAYLVNDYALSVAGIDENSEIDGGEFIKVNGKLTGVLIDNAMRGILRMNDWHYGNLPWIQIRLH